jgi:hypothetical protein
VRLLKAYCFAKKHYSKSTNSEHIDKTNQAGQANGQSSKGRQVGWVNVPALIANIFAAATNRTNIHNKTSSLYNEMFMELIAFAYLANFLAFLKIR